MTTREAIAICRAEAAKYAGPIREALTICAAQAAHMIERRARKRAERRGCGRISLAGGAMEKPQTESPKDCAVRTGEYVDRAGDLESPGKRHAATFGVKA